MRSHSLKIPTDICGGGVPVKKKADRCRESMDRKGQKAMSYAAPIKAAVSLNPKKGSEEGGDI